MLFSRKLDEVSARFADRAADVGSGSLVVDLRAVSATESAQEGAFGCATYQMWCREALLTLGSIYVVDCHDWMVAQVRQLLREILFDRHSSLFGEGSPSEEFSGLVDQILSLNIIHGDHLTLRRLFAESDTSLQTIAGVGQGDQLMLYEWFIAPDGTVGHHKYRMVDIIGNGVK